MTMRVLQSKVEIEQARKELDRLGASTLDSSFVHLMRRFRLIRSVPIGDQVKSWDVLETLTFLDEHISKDSAVLDIGCYASEVPVALHKMGYTNIAGADLNPNLQKMPNSDAINYVVTDFMNTEFEDASFDAITSISVIEHGFDGDALLNEVSRLLKAGGYFIASFDYWPDKIDTSGIKYFEMDWRIFSKSEVIDFVSAAEGYGFSPHGEMIFDAEDRPIDCSNKQYTFGWLVLKKVG